MGLLKEKSTLHIAPLTNEISPIEIRLSSTPKVDNKKIDKQVKAHKKVVITKTSFLGKNAPVTLKKTPVIATATNLSITRNAAILAFSVRFQAITEKIRTSNHLATLVNQPAAKKTENFL
tara:strand:- start:497 stop:856 length:360 start_codon:yes stop_codon:yes gene_type:complete